MYGGQKPEDYVDKFERSYASLRNAGVKFYATLGNQDNPNQRMYKHFNMNGRAFYSFKPRDGVRFFSLDSNYMDRKQIEVARKRLVRFGVGLEDRLLPPPAVFFRRTSRA